ncbi:MAG: Ig-like domain-containing protein, partial [Gemmatimonadota bacterium]|nr:Ig-like domain-containing protein [Gemmatimonadota bacterium]
MIPFLVLAALQQPTPPPPPQAPAPAPSPIVRAEVTPREAVVLVGDSVQLKVTAWDSAGREYADVSVGWFASAMSQFEGSISRDGMVLGGAVGTMSVTAMVRPKAGGRATPALGRVTILPQPASRLVLEAAPSRVYVGQSLVLRAQPYAANGDLRRDEVAWSSDQPKIASISAAGRLTALAPGKATITARAGRASEVLAMAVAANPVTQVSVEPAESQVRTGDVVALRFIARAGGKVVSDVQPEWSFAPGHGQVDPDGRFVADLPGTYRVMASFAGRSAEAVVTVAPRDVRRPTTL